MGTRAVISFRDHGGEFNVYQHWDGDPETVIANIVGTFAVEMCWRFPRWEADEFAAAYIAANKVGEGNIRIAKAIGEYGDLSYSYIVKDNGRGLTVEWRNHYDDLRSTRHITPKEMALEPA